MTIQSQLDQVLAPCPFCGGEAVFLPYKKDGLTLRCRSLGCIRRDQRAGIRREEMRRIGVNGGVALIAAERERQVSVEGWTPEHDDEHDEEQLASAAAAYALPARIASGRWRTDGRPFFWPWDQQWWKPKARIRDLARAGALIAAEIDRLQRASPPSSAAAAKEPEQRCPYCAGLIYSDAGCQNCKVGSVWPKPIAAEQAKPDDNMQLRARVAGELIAARDTEDGCNRIMALIATLDTYTAQTECVAAMYPAEQAQAGELQGFPFGKAMEAAHKMKLEDTEFGSEEVDALHREWDRLPLRDTYAVSLFLDKTMALLRRLAGGVTVDDAAVRRFVDAVNPLVYDLPPPDIIRAALVAALEAK